MLDTHVPPNDAESQSPESSSAARPKQAGLQRAVLYSPIIMLGAVFGAFGMFPELAEHATPLIGSSNSAHCARSSASKHCAGTSQCPGTLRQVGISCSVQSVSKGHSLFKGICCDLDSPAAAVSAETGAADLTTSAEESPADATSAVNAVETEAVLN